jgi:hypothetical protein
MSYVILSAYLNPAPQQSLGEVSRIFYFHVPVAWVSVLAFLVSMLNAVRYLKTRDLLYDIKSSSAAQIGLLFAFLADFRQIDFVSHYNLIMGYVNNSYVENSIGLNTENLTNLPFISLTYFQVYLGKLNNEQMVHLKLVNIYSSSKFFLLKF